MEFFAYEQLRTMNESEFAVYNYVSTHLKEVSQMKIRELSAVTGVSTTTILRFCGKLECEGYQEFQFRLSQYLESQGQRRMYFPSAIHSIQFLQKAEDDPSFDNRLEQTAEWCIKSREVLLVGIGKSAPLAEYGAHLLSGIGITAFAITGPFYPLPVRNMDDTVLIALSVSGKTPEIIAMADGYKQKLVKIVSITNTGHCPLAKMSDISFFYYMPVSPSWNGANMAELTTQIPPLYLLEALMCRIDRKINQ